MYKRTLFTSWYLWHDNQSCFGSQKKYHKNKQIPRWTFNGIRASIMLHIKYYFYIKRHRSRSWHFNSCFNIKIAAVAYNTMCEYRKASSDPIIAWTRSHCLFRYFPPTVKFVSRHRKLLIEKNSKCIGLYNCNSMSFTPQVWHSSAFLPLELRKSTYLLSSILRGRWSVVFRSGLIEQLRVYLNIL